MPAETVTPTAPTAQPTPAPVSNFASAAFGSTPDPAQAAKQAAFDRMAAPAPAPQPGSDAPSVELSVEEFDAPAKVEGVDKDLEVDEPAAPQPTVEPAAPKATPQYPGQRDYTQFGDPEIERVAKRAPNEVFALLEKWNSERKALATEKEQLAKSLAEAKTGRVPDNYFEHPEAFRLLPEYKEAAATFEQDNFEESHWAAQLEAIENGKPWKNLKSYDQHGNPVFEIVQPRKNADGDIVLDVQSKIAVQRALTAASGYKMQSQQQLQAVVQGAKQLHQQRMGGYKQFEDAMFPGLVQPPEALSKEIQGVISKLPPAIAASPLASFIAKGQLFVNAQAAKIKQLEGELAKARGLGAAARAAGPNENDMSGVAGKQGKEFNLAEFGDL